MIEPALEPAASARDPRWFGLTPIEALVLAVGIVLAIVARTYLLSFPSGDFEQFTRGWYEYIRVHGGADALRSGISNYSPLYIYGLILVEALLPNVEPVVAIKLVELPFDFLCAFYVGLIVSLRYRDRLIAIVAGLAVLLAPTVLINGAFWGQVDGISASGILACVYYLQCGRDRAAMIALGAALAFKLQPIFLMPVVVVLLLRRQLDMRQLVWIPILYLAAILPAWLVGRSLWELLTIYLNQAGYYQRLASNSPNVFAWLPPDGYQWFYPAGLAWGAGVILSFIALAARGPRRLGQDKLLQLSLLSVLLVPFCLPKMHERYFFLADVLAIPYAFYFPRYAAIAVVIAATSFLCYVPFLFRSVIIPLDVLPIVLAIVIFILLHQFFLIRRDRRRIESASVAD